MDDEDFDKAAATSSRAIDVVQFVDAAQVDPIYLETSYYIAPQPDLERAYSVLLKALQNTKKAAVVTFVIARLLQMRQAGLHESRPTGRVDVR